MTLVRSEHFKMVDMVSSLGVIGEPCVLGHIHVQYLSIITFRRVVLQVRYSPFIIYSWL